MSFQEFEIVCAMVCSLYSLLGTYAFVWVQWYTLRIQLRLACFVVASQHDHLNVLPLVLA